MCLKGVFVLLMISLVGFCHCTTCNFTSLSEYLNLSSDSLNVRPVLNWTSPTIVNVSMVLYTVIKLDTSTQILTTYLWYTMKWKNEFISWNPNDQCGIKSFFASFDNIWQPDIYINEMTEADGNSPVNQFINISYDGTIESSKPLRVVSTCNADMFKYPFDTQKCTLTFLSYIDSEKIQIIEEFNPEDFNVFSIGEWNVLNVTVVRVKCHDGITYTITLKRNPTLQVISIIIPICFLVILDFAGMFINFTEGGRLMFKVVVVLGLSVLIIVLTTIFPTTQRLPLLCLFCFICMFFMIASLMGCITIFYILSLSETCSQAPPWINFWIKTCLAQVLFFKRDFCKQDRISGTQHVIENGITNPSHGLERDNLPINTTNVTENQLLKVLLKEVQTIQQELTSHRTQENAESDWHVIAVVLNRLFIILYLLAITITFIVVFTLWGTN